MIEKKNARVSRGLIYLFLVIWAIIVLFPFYWMVLTSLKSYSAYNSEYIPKFYTLSPTLQNYVNVFTEVPLGRYLLNTLIFTVATTGLMMLVIVPAAFAFSRLEFKGKNLLFALFLSILYRAVCSTAFVLNTAHYKVCSVYHTAVAYLDSGLWVSYRRFSTHLDFIIIIKVLLFVVTVLCFHVR